jgi:predicted Zn-dependent protease
MVRIIKRLICIAAFFLISGCATLYNPATGRNELIFIDSNTEVALGKNVMPDVFKKHPLTPDQGLQQRVQDVGRRLVSVSDRQDIEYKFYCLEEKELNAAAYPGGYIIVNKGLASILTDDELAYVLGHETGHVAARHITKKLQSGMAYQMLLTVAFIGIGDRVPGAQGIAQGIDTIHNLVALGYDRHDEYEADKLGAKYAFKSGFNPYGSVSALAKIKQQEGPSWKALEYFRSHPYADERIAALKEYIPTLMSGSH